jgi:hypothetical protein
MIAARLPWVLPAAAALALPASSWPLLLKAARVQLQQHHHKQQQQQHGPKRQQLSLINKTRLPLQ